MRQRKVGCKQPSVKSQVQLDQEYEERRRVAEQILLILREAGHSCVLAEDADLRLPGRLLSCPLPV
jgi:hypothetical protein